LGFFELSWALNPNYSIITHPGFDKGAQSAFILLFLLKKRLEGSILGENTANKSEIRILKQKNYTMGKF
jgi:hypothetical protein